MLGDVASADRALLETRSVRMEQALGLLRRVASVDATVLLRGETGTGKEVLARTLHQWSPRRERAFFVVNCAALCESLLDSELFGHERGAFTGAVRCKRGAVELAEGGTLFLDEIGELSLATQTKLLRLIQEREFMRVGGEQVLRCDVRLVAATHRDLEAMVAQGQFRADLYYRIQVVPVHLPALRDRPEDLLPMAAFLLRKLARRWSAPVPVLSPEAAEVLLGHRWPGNLRELENVLARALLLCDGAVIERVPLDLRPPEPVLAPEPALATEPVLAPELAPGPASAPGMDAREHLARLLGHYRGNVNAAARAGRIPRRTFYRRLAELHLDPRSFRDLPLQLCELERLEH